MEPSMSVVFDLHLLCEKAFSLGAYLGQSYAKACFNEEKDRKLLFQQPTWKNGRNILAFLGLILYRNNIQKEDYMENMPYLYGQLLKAADELQVLYCKVVRNGDGSKLLLDLNKAEEIIKSVVKNSTKPVTLKFRKGWNDENIVVCELAKIAEKCGVSAITIHGRTREEYYSGKADLDIIKTVKESVKIPVIGNGDIIDEESALRMLEYTGVDGIMIGRGAIGNPWIFEQIKYYLENNKKMSAPTNKEKYEIIKEHLELNLKEKGNVVGINEMRKHISAYTKNMPEASRFRDEINHITDVNILMSKIQEFFIDIFDKK